MEILLQEICIEAMRVLFLLSAPCIAVAAIVGLLSGALQTVTSIHEIALSYALKLLALIALASLCFVPMRESLTELLIHCLKG